MKPTDTVVCKVIGFCQLADAFSFVEAQNDKAVEIRLHPLDFEALLRGHGILVPTEAGGEGEAGVLWGAKVFADPTFPKGLAHVKGKRFYATVATQEGLREVLPKP